MAKRGKLNRKKTSKDVIERPKVIRRYKQFMLIVCEDEGTEPAYFNSFKPLFPENTLYLTTVGTGRNPLGVVQQSINEKKEFEEIHQKTIDFTWAVFDKDDADLNDNTAQQFDEALQLAQQEQIQLAYSNEAFELWLLLHFQKVDPSTPIPRTDIYGALGLHINNLTLVPPVVYTKKKIPKEAREQGHNKPIYINGGKKLVEVTTQYGIEQKAIERAEELEKYHQQHTHTPIQSNPSTRVHHLVKELRAWINFYN